jgi:hypothetical protein
MAMGEPLAAFGTVPSLASHETTIDVTIEFVPVISDSAVELSVTE